MIEIRHPEIKDVQHEKEAYNDLYEDQGIHQLASFYLWLLELLRAKPGQTLLDVSCGEGDLVKFALQQGLQAIGMDFSESALQLGAKQVSSPVFGVANAQSMPLKNDCFDFVTNIGSIEHYIDPGQGIREIKRILKPKGIACILLPNGFCLLGNAKHVWQTGDVFDDGQPIQRYNTLNGWHNLLVENGLIPFQTIKYEMVRPRTSADTLWYLKRPAKLLHLLLTPFLPLTMSNCFVYLCHPSPD